ncbi:MAG TPA: LPXTG cell wall anchor domain-containing protein [Glycomyces sp.]|nr:LPXTG cell wall anchor domain-containing protein [Glycomyces sp.]
MITTLAAAMTILAVPVAAMAFDGTIQINPGNVPTTAAGFEDQDCDQVPDDVEDDQDGWVFVLPSQMGAMGEFEEVRAVFEDADGNEQLRNSTHHGGIDDGPGTSKAYIITPAGWTLISAEADVTGVDSADTQFNLTHTCPGSEVPTTPSPSPSVSPSVSPSESPSESPSVSQSPSQSQSVSQSPTDSKSSAAADNETTGAAGSGLPTTGVNASVLLIIGAAALVGGLGVLYLMRARRMSGQQH